MSHLHFCVPDQVLSRKTCTKGNNRLCALRINNSQQFLLTFKTLKRSIEYNQQQSLLRTPIDNDNIIRMIIETLINS